MDTALQSTDKVRVSGGTRTIANQLFTGKLGLMSLETLLALAGTDRCFCPRRSDMLTPLVPFPVKCLLANERSAAHEIAGVLWFSV